MTHCVVTRQIDEYSNTVGFIWYRFEFRPSVV
jgi:hypothetical protein